MTDLPTHETPGKAPAGPRTGALAIASLVSAAIFGLTAAGEFWVPALGFLGFLSLGLGLVAIRQIRRSRGALRGLSLALAGVGISVLLLAHTGIALHRCRMQDLAAQRARIVERDLTRLTSAFWKYTARHGPRFPDADRWLEVFAREGLVDAATLGAPSGQQPARYFAMNALLSGLPQDQVKESRRTVLFFEREASGPLAGGPGNLRRTTPYSRTPRGHVIAFADGHCEFRSEEQLDLLNWLPEGRIVCPVCGRIVRPPLDWTPDRPMKCPSCGRVLREK